MELTRFTFFVKRVGRVNALHYRRERGVVENGFDPLAHATHSLSGATEVDCHIDENVSALGGSFDSAAKQFAELVQNAVDTTIQHHGGIVTGGWGDGFKVSVAQLIKSGCSVVILVNSSVSGPSFRSTFSSSGGIFCTQNVANCCFSDESTYVGHSKKPSKGHAITQEGNQASMKQQMKVLNDPELMSLDLIRSISFDANSPLFCTSAIVSFTEIRLRTQLEVSSARSHLGLFLSYLGDKCAVKLYKIISTEDCCIDVYFAPTGGSNLHVFSFQNSIFIDAEMYSVDWRGTLVIHVTCRVSLPGERDRRLDMHRLDGVNMGTRLVRQALPHSKLFLDEVLFDPTKFTTFHTMESHRPRGHFVQFLNILVTKFENDLENYWNTTLVPCQYEETVARFPSIPGLQPVLTPSFYTRFFNAESILHLREDLYPTEPSMELFLRKVQDTIASISSNGPGDPLRARVLHFTLSDMQSLDKIGVFRNQAAVFSNSTGLVYKASVFYLPSNANVSPGTASQAMTEVRLIHPSHQNKLWEKAILEDERCREAAKNGTGVRQVFGQNHVTPETQMPKQLMVGSNFPFGGYGKGPVTGQGSDLFLPYSILVTEDGVVLENITGTRVPRTRATQMNNICDLADSRDTDIFFPPRYDTDEKYLKLLGRVFKFMALTVFPTFSLKDESQTWSPANWQQVICSICYTCGHAGHEEQHLGSLDDPMAKLSSLGASIRFACLMSYLGYKCHLMMNQCHCFVAVRSLLMNNGPNSLTYVECTTPTPVVYTHKRMVHLQKTLMLHNKRKRDEEPVARKKKRTGAKGCFCNQKMPPWNTHGTPVTWWECFVCGRDYHSICANMRVSENGTRICLACQPHEEGCFCGTLIHFKGYGDFSGEWIGCDNCERWCHKECVSSIAPDGSYTCSMDGKKCIGQS
jgi:hypothetical protein